jgi:hypothetical protein
VRLYTAAVEEVLWWFRWTHQLQVWGGVVRWERTSLPCEGGLNHQPAKLMESLAWLREHANVVLLPRQQNRRHDG